MLSHKERGFDQCTVVSLSLVYRASTSKAGALKGHRALLHLLEQTLVGD